MNRATASTALDNTDVHLDTQEGPPGRNQSTLLELHQMTLQVPALPATGQAVTVNGPAHLAIVGKNSVTPIVHARGQQPP
jgi:hypothetical protein